MVVYNSFYVGAFILCLMGYKLFESRLSLLRTVATCCDYFIFVFVWDCYYGIVYIVELDLGAFRPKLGRDEGRSDFLGAIFARVVIIGIEELLIDNILIFYYKQFFYCLKCVTKYV